MIHILIFAIHLSIPVPVHESPLEAKLVRVNRIWDRDSHSAFTDLIRWQDRFICVFRTGGKHVSADGALQLISSEDGSTWQPLSRITSPTADLRDPKLGIGKSGELLVFAAGAQQDKKQTTHQTYLWRSVDGKCWSAACPIGESNSWLWRINLHAGQYYGWGYGTSKERFVRFYQSTNGNLYTPLTSRILQEKGYPNETGLVMEGEYAWCLLRRDGKGSANTALLGTSKAPYSEWAWRDTGVQIGGPVLLRLPAGQFLACVRLYAPQVRTALCVLDTEKAKLSELLTLPSSGDCSYAGMVWHQQKLWISYYSSHDAKTSIYFAEVDVKQE